jgi:hypothetical protein
MHISWEGVEHTPLPMSRADMCTPWIPPPTISHGMLIGLLGALIVDVAVLESFGEDDSA